MTIDTAIKILKEYNKWRLGSDTSMLEPTEITDAINRVIKEYEKTNTPEDYQMD